MEREELRALTTDLIQRLRNEASVPQALWELLDVFARRLDRIELGNFDSQEETPTEPARRVSSGSLPATKPFARVGEILEKAKTGVPGKKDGE
jgi:hypothetical protein